MSVGTVMQKKGALLVAISSDSRRPPNPGFLYTLRNENLIGPCIGSFRVNRAPT